MLPVVLLRGAKHGPVGQRMRLTAAFKVRLYYGNGLLLFLLAAVVLAAWALVGRPFTELGLGWGRTPYDPVAIGVMFAFF